MSTTTTLLSIDEYVKVAAEIDQPTELVRGRIVTMNVPAPRHGQVCTRAIVILSEFVDKHDLGHVLSNDSGVITERDPDTLRGADVAFYGYEKIPKGRLPAGYLSVVPDLVFEVRSPSDRRSEVLAKIAEYLNAGVRSVCLLDLETETAEVYSPDQPTRQLQGDDEVAFPDLLGEEFCVPVKRFFE